MGHRPVDYRLAEQGGRGNDEARMTKGYNLPRLPFFVIRASSLPCCHSRFVIGLMAGVLRSCNWVARAAGLLAAAAGQGGVTPGFLGDYRLFDRT